MRLVTPDEATTKWCPFVRVILRGQEAHSNRGTNADQATSAYHCIADECMAWVVHQPTNGYCALIEKAQGK